MTEKKLRYFLTVAECENMSQAAEKLYMAQPALSKVISGIEEDLGYYLFDRVGKRIVLNQNGKLFCKYARSILNDYENIRSSLAELNHEQEHSLCVGVSASSQLLPLLLRQFREKRNDENDQIQMKASYPLDFHRDEIDILIDAQRDRQEVSEKEYLLCENILLAVPSGHPLEARKRVCFEDTLQYPYVLPAQSTCMGELLAKFFEEQGIAYPQNAMVTNNSYVQCELVAQGLGISFVPEKSWIYARKLDGIILRSVEDVNMQRHIFFQYHPNKYRTQLMTGFGNFLKQYYGMVVGREI